MDSCSPHPSAVMVRRAVDIFYDLMLEDPAMSAAFSGVDLARLRSHQRALITAAIVGGDLYDRRRIREAHRGLDLDDRVFDRAVEHLRTAMLRAGANEGAVLRVAQRLEPLRADILGH